VGQSPKPYDMVLVLKRSATLVDWQHFLLFNLASTFLMHREVALFPHAYATVLNLPIEHAPSLSTALRNIKNF
jgi:hypothetical protein